MNKKFLILKDIEEGKLSLRQLAEKYGCSLETIIRIKKEGWSYRPHGRRKSHSIRRKVIRMYEEGLSIREISTRIDENISESAIRKIVKEPDRILEEHLRWYVKENRWQLFEKHIGELYVVDDKALLSSIPDERLPDYLKIHKYIYLYCNTNRGVEETINDLRKTLDRIEPYMKRTRLRVMGFIIYLLPQRTWDNREDYSKTVREAAAIFEENMEALRNLGGESYLLALSTYCLYLTHANHRSFMKYTNELIRGLRKVKDPCVRNALMTRLRILGFPQFADKNDPNQVVSVLFSGDLNAVKELYEKNRHVDIDTVRNRLNYSMFYVNLLTGRLDEARHFLEKLLQEKSTPGISKMALKIAESNLMMVSGRKKEALRNLEPLIDQSADLSILFGRTRKAFTPRHRISRYYEMGKLKEAYRMAKKYHLMGLLMIVILTRPKHITRLKNFPELKLLHKLLSGKDLRVRVLLLKKRPRITYLKDTLELNRDQSIFLLKFLDTNHITVPRKRMRRYRKIINILKNSCTIQSYVENDSVKIWIRERNIFYDIHEFEQKARQSMALMESGRTEEANRLKKEARKMVQAIPFFQDACRDLEASYILDRLLNYVKYVNA